MKVLMVCLGNICRSPMAQGVLEKKIREQGLPWFVDSAGTSGWHDGENPDYRAIATSKARGVDISRQISRKLTHKDLIHFDLILAMDSSNYQDILSICKTESERQKVQLLTNFSSPGKNMAIPDPYYKGNFDEVFDMLDEHLNGLIHAFVKEEKPA
jgi:protein-tyrosine phosphatase